MIRHTLPAFLIAAALLAAPSIVSAQQAPDPERVAVQRVITTLAEHIQAGNLAAIDTLFRARGHVLTDTATTHSWTEYRDRFLKPELAAHQGQQYAHTAVEAVVRGALAYVAYRRAWTQASPSAAYPGRGTAVLEKIDGRWVIVHLHVSS